MPTVKRKDQSGERGKRGMGIKNRIAHMERAMKSMISKK